MEVLCIGNVKLTSHHIIQWNVSIIVQGTQCTICLVPVPWLPNVKFVRLRKENEKISYQGKTQMYTKKLHTIKHVDPLPWITDPNAVPPLMYLDIVTYLVF